MTQSIENYNKYRNDNEEFGNIIRGYLKAGNGRGTIITRHKTNVRIKYRRNFQTTIRQSIR
ncbi:hypothetical protein HS5_03260 [Acidianus sp. HS-5]|nr:hypothetical protein HS5_03260 [Acidianus sp. HS-5]